MEWGRTADLHLISVKQTRRKTRFGEVVIRPHAGPEWKDRIFLSTSKFTECGQFTPISKVWVSCFFSRKLQGSYVCLCVHLLVIMRCLPSSSRIGADFMGHHGCVLKLVPSVLVKSFWGTAGSVDPIVQSIPYTFGQTFKLVLMFGMALIVVIYRYLISLPSAVVPSSVIDVGFVAKEGIIFEN